MKKNIQKQISWKQSFCIAVSYQVFILSVLFAFIFFYFESLDRDILRRLFRSWDSEHYMDIAEFGYQSNDPLSHRIAWFPLYPWIVRLLSPVFGGDFLVAGVILSNIFSIIGHACFIQWVQKLGFSKTQIWKAAVLLFVSPISVYFIQCYTESLYLALFGIFALALSSSRFWVSSVAGFLITLSRPPGFLMMVAYSVELIKKKKPNWFTFLILGNVIIGSGLMVYLFVNYLEFHDPFYFLKMQQHGWNKSIGNPFRNYYLYLIQFIKDGPSSYDYPSIFYDLIASIVTPIIFMIYFFFLKKKQLPFSFQMMATAQILLILSTGSFLSNLRLIALIIPVYLIIVELTEKYKWLYASVIVIFAAECFRGFKIFSSMSWFY